MMQTEGRSPLPNDSPGPRIKIFTRSFDLRLYRRSKALYEELGYPTVRLTDCSADGYFYKMLKDTECDVAVNIDEDAFLVDPAVLRDLIRTVLEGGYANAGCPDGGTDAVPRSGDPRVTNPFFNILDLRQIRPAFQRRLMVRKDEDVEPYYPFFHWLSDRFTTLYLPAEKHPDGLSTILKDPSGRTICLHSWFARFYSMPRWMVRRLEKNEIDQPVRIEALIDQAYAIRGLRKTPFTAADRLAFAANDLVRWVIKIPQRISRWPYKIARAVRRRQSSHPIH
ncbi:MAG: hypothetical protein IJ654_01460 [Bacteroidales bacterium]|nr:hypothetical protein [Bacteroidales bacterium]